MAKPRECTIFLNEKMINVLADRDQHDNGIKIRIDDGHGNRATIYLPQSEAEELAEFLQEHYE